MLIFKSITDVKSRQLRGKQKRQKGCEDDASDHQVSLLRKGFGGRTDAQRLRRSQVDAIDLIDDIEAIEEHRAEDESGGRKEAQKSRGFGDADVSLSGFGIGTNGTDRTNKARFRLHRKGFGGYGMGNKG